MHKYVSSKNYNAILNKHGLKEVAKDGSKEWVEKSSKAAAKKSVKDPGMVQKALQWLFRHPKVAGIMKQHGLKVASNAALKELAEKAVKAGAKKSTIIALRTAANFIPYANIVVAVGFFIWDFTTGFWNANKYFKVRKEDVTIKMRSVSAMIKALQGLIASTGILFLIGLIPLEWLLDWTKKWFFSEDEIKDMERSRDAEMIRERKETIANMKDPVAKKKAEDDLRDEQRQTYNNIMVTKPPTNGSYYNKGELTAVEEDAYKTIKLENAIKATKASISQSSIMQKFWDSAINKTREGRDKDRKQVWWKGAGWDTDALASDYAAMKLFTQNSEAMLELNKASALNYTFANGYTYQEVGCIPSSLADIYRSLGYEPDEMEMAMTADYYANYINGGKGLPLAYALDMAVLDGFGVNTMKKMSDIDTALAKGERVLMLTKYNGSNHAIAIVGKTDEGRYMVYDRLRSNSPMYMDINDPAFKAMSSAISIGAGGKKDYEYVLDASAYNKLANPNVDLNSIGTFANIGAISEAKAWAKLKIKYGETKKPKDFNYIDSVVERKYKEFGIPAGLSKQTMKNILIRDLFNDKLYGKNTISFGKIKRKDGTWAYGNFKTYENGPLLTGDKAILIDSSGKEQKIAVDESYYVKVKTKDWWRTNPIDSLIGNNKEYIPYDKTADFIIGGINKNLLTKITYNQRSGYADNKLLELRSNVKFNSKAKDIKLSDGLGKVAQGSIDLERRNTLINKQLNFNKALEERFNRLILSQNRSNSSLPERIIQQTTEVMRTDKIEKLLGDISMGLMMLIEIQRAALSKDNSSNMIPSISSSGSNDTTPDSFMSAISDIVSGKL
jgi:hypothetical protein